MSERSVSMVTPMVLAVNTGTKTNTRRILRIQPPDWANDPQQMVGPFCTFHGMHPKGRCGHAQCACINEEHGGTSMWTIKCPYGKAGDVLKLKEAAWMWCEKVRDGLTPKKRPKYRYVPVEGAKVLYVADMPRDAVKPATPQAVPADRVSGQFVWRLKIPRYMPSFAVRTRLQIVSIRVERLQDITEKDAEAEGAELCEVVRGHKVWHASYFASFRSLWESINGPDSWAANPFVFRIEFKKV